MNFAFSDTSTQNYFKSKTHTIREDDDDHIDASVHHHKSSMNQNEIVDKRESSSKDKFDIQQTNQKRPLIKKDSIDIDCKFYLILLKFLEIIFEIFR